MAEHDYGPAPTYDEIPIRPGYLGRRSSGLTQRRKRARAPQWRGLIGGILAAIKLSHPLLLER